MLKRAAAKSSSFALALSLALHAAPLAYMLHRSADEAPESAGESLMEVEFVVAEAETLLMPLLETPPDPMSVMPPAADIAQVKAQDASEQSEETDEITAPALSQPENRIKAEETLTTRANAAPIPHASAEMQAAASEAYRARLARHLARFKRFPAGLPGTASGGRVIIRFSLGEDGALKERAILQSAGFAIIDAEAMAMLARAAPFPAPPSGASRSFTLPISYKLKE